MQEKPHNNVIRSIIDILKLFCWTIWYMYDIICDIWCNYSSCIITFIINSTSWTIVIRSRSTCSTRSTTLASTCGVNLLVGIQCRLKWILSSFAKTFRVNFFRQHTFNINSKFSSMSGNSWIRISNFIIQVYRSNPFK